MGSDKIKHLAVLLLSITLFVACNKQPSPNEVPTKTITGTYQMQGNTGRFYRYDPWSGQSDSLVYEPGTPTSLQLILDTKPMKCSSGNTIGQETGVPQVDSAQVLFISWTSIVADSCRPHAYLYKDSTLAIPNQGWYAMKKNIQGEGFFRNDTLYVKYRGYKSRVDGDYFELWGVK